MKTILVIGGAGFIGSHTVVELVSNGYRPVVIDNFSNSDEKVMRSLEKLIKKKITYYVQDFQDIKKLSNVVAKEKPQGVIHFAAHKVVGESVKEPLKYYTNNVSGLIDLLNFIDTTDIANFVFSSSCTVYGNPDVLPVTEQSEVKPAESPYGATKQMGENILRDYVRVSNNLNALALRYFNPIGAHLSGLIGELPIGVPANLVPLLTQTAAGVRENLMVHGNDYDTVDGSCVRDYIHVVDLAKAHVKSLNYLEKEKPAHFDIFNIGTGKGSSVLEVIKAFEKISGKKLNYEIGPRRAGDIASTHASVEKAMKNLGWSAEKTLKDALTDAWNWQQKLTENLEILTDFAD